MLYAATDPIIADIKTNLAAYLREGDAARGIVGLNGVGEVVGNGFLGLRFCLSEGTGTPDDPPLWARAEVIFQDDDLPGAPCARITLAGGGDADFAGDSDTLAQWQLRVDVAALGGEGALTDGLNARSAEDVLASWIRRMLRGRQSYAALSERGFHQSSLRIEGELSRDAVFRNPMVLTFTTEEEI